MAHSLFALLYSLREEGTRVILGLHNVSDGEEVCKVIEINRRTFCNLLMIYIEMNLMTDVEMWWIAISFPSFSSFNVLMQPKAMKHSIVSTYIDIHRVVLMIYVVWKSSLRETGLRAKNHTVVSSRCNLNSFSIPSQVSSRKSCCKQPTQS